jgi:excisionase family DNA binding protein
MRSESLRRLHVEHPAARNGQARTEINRQIQEFLDRGGQIEVLDIRRESIPVRQFNRGNGEDPRRPSNTSPDCEELDGVVLISAREVAKRLGVVEGTVYCWARAGKLPAPRKDGARLTRWVESEVDEWIAAGLEAGTLPRRRR